MLRFCLLFVLVPAALFAGAAEDSRGYGGYYSAERLANARRNAVELDWARRQCDTVVAKAKPWAARSDEELWAMVPGQQLGRCIDVTFDTHTAGPKVLGCLRCGPKIFRYGNYPYNPDFVNRPWKLTCPSCGAIFPTNDFGKYYQSGIDEHGVFDPAKADRSLLFNTAHPDPKDPLHTFGVDDGFGYVAPDGRSYRFIGYYTWKYWGWIQDGTKALADAFVLTGDRVYAHKAAVLLDRLADLYPSLDWKPYAERGWFHSDGSTGRGKIGGAIWETGVARTFAESYDAILSGTEGDEALFAFLGRQSQRYQLPHPKGTRELFVQNVDDGLLRCAFQAVRSGQIAGNEGMQQLTVTALALALNSPPETTQWLDWLFAPDGGAIPGLMLGHLDRDGVSDEGAPGYALFWGQMISEVAARLADYPAYTHHDIFREFPPFRATFTAAARLTVLGVAEPNLGDTGATGLVANKIDPDFIAKGYRYTRDPELAVAAWRAEQQERPGSAGDGPAKKLGRDIFSADPDALGREIERIGSAAGAASGGSDLMTGFNLALLESGSGSAGFALVCNYGRTLHHAHADQLNFDLFAYGHWLAPDLGYPEFAAAWPSRNEWTVNTLSHNTVFVDGQAQRPNWGGRVRLFQRLPGLTALQLEAAGAYPQTKEYARTLLLIDAPTASGASVYVVDVFHVVGGKDQVYSFHGPPGPITVAGLELVPQAGGTYAGSDIPFATPSGRFHSDDDSYNVHPPPGVPPRAPSSAFPLGYSYLYDVRRDRHPATSFTLDWKAEAGYRGLAAQDDVHLRLHVLGAYDDVALADGDPPQNKPGNPRRIGYALLHRAGSDLTSTFVTVIEPYRATPFLKSVRRLPAGGDDRVALRIELAGGAVDYVLVDPTGVPPLRLADGDSLTGGIGYVREIDGRPVRAALAAGSALVHGALRLSSPGVFTGKVVKMNRGIAGGGLIWVDAALPTDGSLAGQQIMIATDGPRDACYTIRRIERDGALSRVDCGPITFVRGFRGPSMKLRKVEVPVDYTHGYLYDFELGAAFVIPLAETWSARANPPL